MTHWPTSESMKFNIKSVVQLYFSQYFSFLSTWKNVFTLFSCNGDIFINILFSFTPCKILCEHLFSCENQQKTYTNASSDENISFYILCPQFCLSLQDAFEFLIIKPKPGHLYEYMSDLLFCSISLFVYHTGCHVSILLFMRHF